MALPCMQAALDKFCIILATLDSYTQQVLTPGPMASSMVLVQSGWVVSSVVVRSLDSSTVLPDHWVRKTAHTPGMLECGVHAALMET